MSVTVCKCLELAIEIFAGTRENIPSVKCERNCSTKNPPLFVDEMCHNKNQA